MNSTTGFPFIKEGWLVSGPSIRGRAKVPCWGFSPMAEPLGVLVPAGVAENASSPSLRDLCDQAGARAW